MSGNHPMYGLPELTGSSHGLMSSPAGQENTATDAYNLMPLRPRNPTRSTPSPSSRRRDSTPRRTSPLSGPQLVPDDNPYTDTVPDVTPRLYLTEDAAQEGRSSSQDPFIPGLDLDNRSLENDETRHLRLSTLRHEFNSTKQFWKLLWKGSIRFFFTLATATLLASAIYIFSHKNVISNKWKKWFNAINTGLSLTLGMSIAHGFKAMAIDLRWWILSRHKRSLSEVDLILRIESLTVVLTLLLTSFRKSPWPCKWRWKLLLSCTLWLLANLGAQIAVALVALNYDTEVDNTYALNVTGDVLVPDMNQMYPVGFDPPLQNPSEEAQQYAANSYGNMALGLQIVPSGTGTMPESGQLWPAVGGYFPYSQDGDLQSFIFFFQDEAPLSAGGVWMYSNRNISSTWNCTSFLVTQGGDGTVSNLTLASSGESLNVTIPFPGGSDQTTFITNPNNNTCGTGCSIVSAFEASSTDNSWYYTCKISIGEVMNAIDQKHNASERFRSMASAAIALRGYGPSNVSEQYQIYPSKSFYGEPCGGHTDCMGQNMGQFAIGVVAAYAIYTTQNFTIEGGKQPQIGNQLVVSGWLFIYLILGLLVGAQGLGFVITAFWANRVLVKDGSVFATATLLRSILERLEDSGNAAERKDICNVLGDGPDMMINYTAIEDVKTPDVYHLEFSNRKRRRAFQEGIYE